MSETEETGPVSVALAHGWKLVNDQPELAREQAGEILKVAPANREARLLEAAALRQLGDLPRSGAAGSWTPTTRRIVTARSACRCCARRACDTCCW